MTPDGWPLPEAMVERYHRFHAEGGTPATPRRAATVVLLRPGPAGPEAYVIRRAVSMVFGGVYAFPGGGVDPADAADPLPGWDTRLGLPGPEAAAVVRAAVREVFEEAGVLLAGLDPGVVVGDVSGADWEDDRRALAAREQCLADLLGRRGLAIRDDLLAPWSRWVTPDFEPRRFDTYFFVAVLPVGQRTRDVSGEADLTRWIRPGDAVAGHAAGELPMLPPTAATLRDLAGYATPDEVLAAAAGRDAARPVQPRVRTGPDGAAWLTVG